MIKINTNELEIIIYSLKSGVSKLWPDQARLHIWPGLLHTFLNADVTFYSTILNYGRGGETIY